jgi:hypothetical protein
VGTKKLSFHANNSSGHKCELSIDLGALRAYAWSSLSTTAAEPLDTANGGSSGVYAYMNWEIDIPSIPKEGEWIGQKSPIL